MNARGLIATKVQNTILIIRVMSEKNFFNSLMHFSRRLFHLFQCRCCHRGRGGIPHRFLKQGLVDLPARSAVHRLFRCIGMFPAYTSRFRGGDGRFRNRGRNGSKPWGRLRALHIPVIRTMPVILLKKFAGCLLNRVSLDNWLLFNRVGGFLHNLTLYLDKINRGR